MEPQKTKNPGIRETNPPDISKLTITTIDSADLHLEDISEQSKHYEYDRLEKPGTIRILQLTPASHQDDQLQGSFLVARLAEKPDFEALSYTWGEPVFPRSIQIDGRYLPITENLAQALQHLRSETAVCQLWVDACCINQQDDAEKTKQVLLMGKIYNTASKVLAWLGQSTEHTAQAIALVQELAATVGAIDSTDPSFSIPNIARKFYNDDMPQKAALESMRYWIDVINREELRDIFHRPWFTRLWVVQEMTLASDLVFLLGDHELELSAFMSGLIGYMALPNTFGGSINVDSANQTWEFLMVRKKYFDTRAVTYETPYMQYGVFKDRVISKHCRDPRDRIFALFSMIPVLQEQVSGWASALNTSIGYHKTVAETFRDFTRCFLSQNDVECLHDAGLWKRYMADDCKSTTHIYFPYGTPSSENYLPSWAPNLSRASEDVRTFWQSKADETLCAGGPPKTAEVLILKDQPSHALVKGHILGMVEQVIEKPDNADNTILERHCQCIKNARAMHRAATGIQDPEREGLEFASFMMADGHTDILKGMLGGVHIIRDLDENDFRRLWLDFEEHCLDPSAELYKQWSLHEDEHGDVDHKLMQSAPTEEERQIMAYYLTLRYVFKRHSIVASDEGLVAMAPMGAREGDILAVIAGMRVPMLLRPDQNGLLVIGPCYAKGIMKGASCPEAESKWRHLLLV